MKSEIEEAYADCDGIEYGTCIALQEIKLIDIEGIDICAKEIPLSKWVCDKESTKEQWEEMGRDGKEVDKSIQIGMWEDLSAFMAIYACETNCNDEDVFNCIRI